MQEQIEARAGLNGGGAGRAIVAANAEAATARDGAPPLSERARLRAMMAVEVRRADILSRLTTTDEPQNAMARELGVSKEAFSWWVRNERIIRPATAAKPVRRRKQAPRSRPARSRSPGKSRIEVVKARLISAVGRQIELVEKRLDGNRAKLEEKDSRILGNLAKTLGTLMQIGTGGKTSNQAEPPDRDEDVEARLAERIKRWARGEQGY